MEESFKLRNDGNYEIIFSFSIVNAVKINGKSNFDEI